MLVTGSWFSFTLLVIGYCQLPLVFLDRYSDYNMDLAFSLMSSLRKTYLLLIIALSFALFSFNRFWFNRFLTKDIKKKRPPDVVLSEGEIRDIAAKITVRIFSSLGGDTGGSGVIIYHQEGNYYVITCHHVVEGGNYPYKIAVYDGKIYPAEIVKKNTVNSSKDYYDLALLRFASQDKYPTIKFSENLPRENESVFATGFPFQQNLKQSMQITHTRGILAKILDKPLVGGYQLGYTNLIHTGMSGGAILNRRGELIGINGLGKFPPLGNPYVYQDGKQADEKEIQDFSQLSWGIPVTTIQQFLNQSQ